jgi:hypothetical protein
MTHKCQRELEYSEMQTKNLMNVRNYYTKNNFFKFFFAMDGIEKTHTYRIKANKSE